MPKYRPPTDIMTRFLDYLTGIIDCFPSSIENFIVMGSVFQSYCNSSHSIDSAMEDSLKLMA